MTRWFNVIFVSASFKDIFIWFKKESKSSLFVFILKTIGWNNCSCFELVAYLKQLYYDLIVGIDLIGNLNRFVENYICGLHGCCVGDWSFCWISFNDYWIIFSFGTRISFQKGWSQDSKFIDTYPDESISISLLWNSISSSSQGILVCFIQISCIFDSFIWISPVVDNYLLPILLIDDMKRNEDKQLCKNC